MEKIMWRIDAALHWLQWALLTVIGLAFDRVAGLMIATVLQVGGSA